MLEYQPPFYRDFTVDISDNPSDGHSASYQLPVGMVPVSVSAPADLKGNDRLTFIAADEDADDATGFERLHDEGNSLDAITLATSVTLDVPATVRRGCLGRAYIRILLMTPGGVAEEPTDDVTYRVYFADARIGLT